MSLRKEQLKDAVYNAPYLLPVYLNSPEFDKVMAHSYLRKLLPLRWGIEFECFGRPIKNQKCKHSIGAVGRDNSLANNKRISKKHKDRPYEFQLSGMGYRHLIGLYERLELAKKQLAVAPNGSIHVHIDISGFNLKFYRDIETTRITKKFNKKEILDKVYEICGSRYNGTYNRRGANDGKGYWISTCTHRRTIEYRILDLTFDYNELITQVIELEKLTKSIMLELGYKYTKTTMKVIGVKEAI